MARRRSARQASLPGMGFDEPAPSAPRRGERAAGGASPPPSPSDELPDTRALLSPEGPTLPPALHGKTVYAVDANSLIFQVFHAIPEMTSPRGEPVNAVFGFTRDLLFLRDRKPDYLFCTFDTREPTFRHELFDAYKGQRSEMPDELVPQFPAIRRMIAALGIPILELASYEADDVIATLAALTEQAGGKCVLVTGDKDCRQLISDQVAIFNVRKNQVYDAVALAADWGIRPDQVVDFQSIVGDSVDNIPGIPLIGPKIARELLNKYDTLEGIFEHAGEISGTKRRESVIGGREQAMVSRRLVELDRRVPIAIDWEGARVGPIDPERALALCAEFGFHRFAEQLRATATSRPKWTANYRPISSLDELQTAVARAAAQPQIAVSLVPSSPRLVEAEITGVAIAPAAGEAFYVALSAGVAGGGDGKAVSGGTDGAAAGAAANGVVLERAAALAALRPLLENAAVAKISHDVKLDTILLNGAGIEPAGMTFDTMLASYLLDAGERNHTLGELSTRYLDHSMAQGAGTVSSERKSSAAAESEDGSEAETGEEVDAVETEAAETSEPATPSPIKGGATQSAGEEADVALRLAPLLTERLRDAELWSLFDDLELPLASVLAAIERTGIRIDCARLGELSTAYGARVTALATEIYELAGHEFNIASPKQLQQVLFTELKLPALRRTKSGPSTDASVLEELAAVHPLPAKIIEYRQYAKLKNTYVDALPAMVNPRTGRVHATLQQAVAATGRLSSSDPNLQNIPIRTREGREIRSAFLPGEEGWLLLSADYSQIELRVLAHFAPDETLRAAFARGDDIHMQVASQVFGVAPGEVTAEMRRRAKAVNFGVLYGQSPFGLARSLGISQEEAAAFIAAYFERYPGVDKFLGEILEGCRENGYVKTILGRRRAIRGIRPNPPRQRNLPERTAINTVIQGSAADLIKLAMLAVFRRMQERQMSARMLLQIHDELLFEAPAEEIDALASLVRHEMAAVGQMSVPLVVDVKTGRNWAQTELLGATDN